MQRRLRILFLCCRWPVPMDTGAKIRTFHLLEALSRNHDVRLVTFAAEPVTENARSRVERLCTGGVSIIHNPGIDRTSMLKLAMSYSTFSPYSVVKYRSAELRNALVRSGAAFQPDFVHCDHLQMAQYVRGTEGLARTPWLLDEHNIETELWSRMADDEHGPKKAVLASQQLLMERFEKRACANASAVITCSEQDAQWVRKRAAQKNTFVVPNGVDVSYFTPGNRLDATHTVEEPESVAFVGSMDWLPNKRGVIRFLTSIWPAIKAKLNSPRFYVVGRNPGPELLARAEHDPSVLVTGTVDDVRSYVERSALCVVPLYVGGGTRLKILEAFAMGKCVVSTELGAEGIECVHGKDILIAQNDAQFVELMAMGLRHPQLLRDIGQAARKRAVTTYGWPAIGEKLLAVVDELVPRAAVPMRIRTAI